MLLADPVRFVVQPLRGREFAALAAAATLLFAGYCQLHGVLAEGRVSPGVSIAWGVSLAVPWWSAWEACKRLGAMPTGVRAACVVALLCAALLTNVAAQHAIGIAVHPQDHATFLELAYARAPVACAMGIGALLLRPWRMTVRTAAAGTASVRDHRNGYAGESMRAHPLAADARTSATVSSDVPSISDACTPASAPMAMPASPVLHVPTRDGVVALAGERIDYVRAAGNYVELVSNGRPILLRATLHEVEARLAPAGFTRIHRSLLVNAARVARLQRDARKLPAVRLQCGTVLPVGRRYVEAARVLAPSRPH